MCSLIDCNDLHAQTFKKQTNTLSTTFGRKVSQYIYIWELKLFFIG